MERSGLRFEHFFLKWSKIGKQNKIVFFLADFAIKKNMLIPDGLETYGGRAYR